MNYTLLVTALPQLIHGLVITVLIAGVTFLGVVTVGMVGAALRISAYKPARICAAAFVEFFRNTPPLVQMYFLFFGLPALPLIGVRLPAYVAATLALVAYQGAIQIEIFRAGLTAVPRGQVEAGSAIGLSPVQQLLWILFPQALRISLPAMSNNVVSLIKNTSLVSAVGVMDMTGVANDNVAIYLSSVEFFATIAIGYLGLSVMATSMFRNLEARFERAC